MKTEEEKVNLVLLYKKYINIFNPYVEVRSIHRDNDLCFNSDQREILYAIETCFNSLNTNEDGTLIKISYFKESMLGKCVQLSFENVPEINPFKNIMKHYKKYYLQRLTLLNNYYESKVTEEMKQLNKKKIENKDKNKKEFNHLNNNYSTIIYLPLPIDIIKTIYSCYLEYKLDDYLLLRKKYNMLRKYIND